MNREIKKESAAKAAQSHVQEKYNASKRLPQENLSAETDKERNNRFREEYDSDPDNV